MPKQKFEILITQGSAVKVLEALLDRIKTVGAVSVNELHDLCGRRLEHHVFENDAWGWSNLDEAEIKETDDGFLIVLPETQKIID